MDKQALNLPNLTSTVAQFGPNSNGLKVLGYYCLNIHRFDELKFG
ncbi:MAG: hypothetical protein ACYS67_05380 [Planctomycetota bacterium]|jgi:hypothetical protein